MNGLQIFGVPGLPEIGAGTDLVAAITDATQMAGQPLAAEVTDKAIHDLGLHAGRVVVATWKATATRLIAL